MRVAVIGAGASGLASAKEFQDRGHDVVVLEQGLELGGVWAYEPEVEDDLLGLKPRDKVYSSLYENLRTNLPSDLMAFKGFPFTSRGGGEDSWPRFPHHSCVRQYLQRFVAQFDLAKLIRFNQRVESVVPIEGGLGWRLRCSAGPLLEFEAVVVCSGHFSEPRVPALPGLKQFKGELRHSHNYRNPAIYRDQTVAVLGCGASGADIVQEMLPHATEVNWCGFAREGRSKKLRFREFPDAITEQGLVIQNQEVKVDAILFCTGYRYELPFISDDIVAVSENYVSPLYKDIIPPTFPRLGFVGLPFLVVPFPLYAMQAKWFASSLEGDFKLPDTQEMLELCRSREQTLMNSSVEKRHFHRLGELQGHYYDDLAQECGAPLLPKWFSELVEEAKVVRQENPSTFRDVALSMPRQEH